MKDSKYITIENYKTRELQETLETSNPSLVVFPYNHPKLECLNDETQSKWLVFENKNKKFRDEKMLLGATGTILYESKSRMEKNLSNYVIGIYNKKKRKLKFVDVESNLSS